MKETKKLVEFLLWDNCNNHCKFCFLKENNPCPSFLTEEERAKSLSAVKFYVENNWIDGDDILLCGGELFDTPMTKMVNTEFYGLLQTIIKRMTTGSIGCLYINTNLLYDINISLVTFLTTLSAYGLINRLRFTTSYDVYGRYKSEEDRALFFNNVSKIKQMFPVVHIVTNIVMTKQFCDSVRLGFDVDKFQQKYGLEVNLIPYIILTEDMSPSRVKVMNTITKVNKQVPGYINTMVSRFTNNISRKLLKFYNGELRELTSGVSECGHSENFKRYTTKGSCFICDLVKLQEKLNGKLS